MKLLTNLFDRRPGLIILFVVLVCWGANLAAPLGMIDDHEIVGFLGPDQQLSLGEIPQLLWEKTEVGQWGTALRYRPLYYLLRFGEIALWGANSVGWYLGRLLLAGYFFWQLFLLLRWVLASRPLAGLENRLALLMLLMVMYQPFWRDIFCRLGPSEIYAMAGLALMGMAGRNLWGHAGDVRWGPWAIFTIGGLLMIGAKENMLILFFYLLLAIWWAPAWKKKLILATSFLVQLLFGIWIVLGLFWALRYNGGRDIYGEQRAVSTLISKIGYLLGAKNLLWFSGIVGLWVYYGVKNNFRLKNADRQLFILVGPLLVGYFSQVIFYGELPKKNRYDFPGELFKYFAIFCTLLVGWQFLPAKVVGKIHRYLPVSILLLAVLTIHRQLPASIKNVQMTRSFARQLQQLVAVARTHPEQAIIFFTERLEWDLEPVVSVARYLQFYQVTNPLMAHPLEPIVKGSAKDTALARQLIPNFTKMVEVGGDGLVAFDPAAMEKAQCLGVAEKKAAGKWQGACAQIFSPW